MVRVMLAESLIEEGRSGDNEALAQLAQAEEATPADPDIYSLRGKIYFSRGEYENAVNAIRRAIDLQPSSSAYHYQLALAYRRLGKEAQARGQLDIKAHLEQGVVPDLTRTE